MTGEAITVVANFIKTQLKKKRGLFCSFFIEFPLVGDSSGVTGCATISRFFRENVDDDAYTGDIVAVYWRACHFD
ncbi:MAG: hypothetical protein KIS65_05485 [Nitrosomonas sp.]|nr:hypothetical protein [Nitrosomonas sp.]MCW5618647.1 hypothetical protein [Nitrosomonas sp.]